MARNTTNAGLYVWDLMADRYDHTQLAANWDTIDSYFGGFDPTTKLPKRLHTTATVPVSGTLGDTVFLTAANGGFAANTHLKYNGSAWTPIGYEILPAVPSSGNFAGRLVILSSASGTFPAWSAIRYDGSAWDIIGGWSSINTGNGANNIVGVQSANDAYINNSARGFIMKDRGTGTLYRLYFQNGNLAYEVVS